MLVALSLLGAILGGAWICAEFRSAKADARGERRLRIRDQLRHGSPEAPALSDAPRLSWRLEKVPYRSHYFAATVDLTFGSWLGVLAVEDLGGEWLWCYYMPGAWEKGGVPLEEGRAKSGREAQLAAEAWFFAAEANGFFRN